MQKLQMVEFGVTGLAEVRTLMRRWKQVMANLAREGVPAAVWKTHRQVGIEVEDGGRGRRCCSPSWPPERS